MIIDPKEYLGQIEIYAARIEQKIEELAQLRALTTKITVTLKQDAGFGGGDSGDKLGAAIAKIDEMEREIAEDIDRYRAARKDIENTLEMVSDPMEYKILSKRYVLLEKLEQIACEIPCSYRQTCRVHGDALQTIRKILIERNQESENNQKDVL